MVGDNGRECEFGEQLSKFTPSQLSPYTKTPCTPAKAVGYAPGCARIELGSLLRFGLVAVSASWRSNERCCTRCTAVTTCRHCCLLAGTARGLFVACLLCFFVSCYFCCRGNNAPRAALLLLTHQHPCHCCCVGTAAFLLYVGWHIAAGSTGPRLTRTDCRHRETRHTLFFGDARNVLTVTRSNSA